MGGIWHAAWWQLCLLATYAAIVIVVFSRHFVVSYELRRAIFLSRRSPAIDDAEAPLVSILVPAKDEAAGIDACLASLVSQDYPNFEILVVDDRSQDDTGVVVARRAAQDPRIRLLRIDELPPQWTGKTHALHVAQSSARGDWLFFVDADTLLHPQCLRILMADCLRSGAQMESLMPALVSDSFWVSAVQPLASMLLLMLYPLSRVNNASCSSNGFANGQFILVHRDAYARMGGHEGVRNQLCEDIYLGRKARTLGIPLRVVAAPELAAVRMYSTLRESISGWSRIFYSTHAGRARLGGLAALLGLFSVLPYLLMVGCGAALLAGSASPVIAAVLGLAAAHELFQWSLYARLFRLSGTSLRFLPFRTIAVFVMLRILSRSIRMCRTHEVIWRGTTYTAELGHREPAGRAAA